MKLPAKLQVRILIGLVVLIGGCICLKDLPDITYREALGPLDSTRQFDVWARLSHVPARLLLGGAFVALGSALLFGAYQAAFGPATRTGKDAE